MRPEDRAIHALTAQRGHIIESTMERLVPGYPRRRRVRDLEAGIGQAFDAIIACSTENRRLTEDDIPFLRPVVRNALLRGGTEAEILAAPLLFFRVLWDGVVRAVGGTADGDRAIVQFVPTALEYVETASRIGHETHLAVSEAQNSLSSVARFELATRLLSGAAPETGVQLSLARRCGLVEGVPVLAVVARSSDESASEVALQMAMRLLSRVCALGGVEPLAVVRDGEIIILRATRSGEADALASVLRETQGQLLADGVPLTMATSTIHADLTAVPAAHDEACLALETLDGRAELLCLETLGTFDYLMLHAGRSAAWRLVPEPIRAFVAAELTGGRVLINTLQAYVDCDLNVKRAAEVLHVHPNTAHYRLERIAERTGCNLRRFADLEQLLIAVRLGLAGAPG